MTETDLGSHNLDRFGGEGDEKGPATNENGNILHNRVGDKGEGQQPSQRQGESRGGRE